MKGGSSESIWPSLDIGRTVNLRTGFWSHRFIPQNADEKGIFKYNFRKKKSVNYKLLQLKF